MGVKTDRIRRDHRHVTDDVVDGETGEPSPGGGSVSGASRWLGPFAWDIADLEALAGNPNAIMLSADVDVAEGDYLLRALIVVETAVADATEMQLLVGDPDVDYVVSTVSNLLPPATYGPISSDAQLILGFSNPGQAPKVVALPVQAWVGFDVTPGAGIGVAFIEVFTPAT